MLTKREEEVMDLVVKGYNNREIAELLTITSHTTKAHLASIFTKLNVANRVQATVKYIFMKKLTDAKSSKE